MSSSTVLNICIDQGSDYRLELTITDDLGDPVDLTDHTFRGQIRKSFSSSDIEGSFTFDKVLPLDGRVDVLFSAAQSTAISLDPQKSSKRKAQNMSYDIESETSGAKITRWLYGVAAISPEVTR